MSETCRAGNDFDDTQMGARISSVFVIMLTSAIGVFIPILSSRYSVMKLPDWLFFGAKYFGTGVIIATGVIHLLSPANEYLTDECLGGAFLVYPWAFATSLLALFSVFFIELLARRWVGKKAAADIEEIEDTKEVTEDAKETTLEVDPSKMTKEEYFGQLVSTCILEFGILFHSTFVGLTLAVSGKEFTTFYIVLVFHQMFEGLGLGTRVSSTVWPANKKWLPYLFGTGYALITPAAIAIGLGVRSFYPPESRRTLIIRGFFDAFCSGILIYSGIVELMAHEILYCNTFKNKPNEQMFAFALMCAGVTLMGLLGYWV